MSTPAGWYPEGDGLRYWDGTRWTEHVAPAPAPADVAARPAGTVAGPAAWFGWGGLVAVTFLGGLTSGVSGFFMGAGGYVLVVALVALVRGRVGWARLPGRAAAGVALAGAVGLAGIGGATADPAPTTTAAPPAAAVGSPEQDPSPTTTTPTPTPTPSATPTGTPSPSATPTPTTTRPAAAPGTALAALATVAVKGRAPKTGYDRAEFGPAWKDVDRNGCDTRNDILRRDLRRFTLKAGTNGCLVLSGTLTSPYTGSTRAFVRGQGTSSAVQIDHVVALSDAWQKGAQRLDAGTRTAFANDPLNLLAVEGSVNQAKGDGDAATWLPPRKGYRCAYVARQVAVKVRYRLWMTAAEHDAVERILATCPTQRLPSAGAIALGGGTVVSAPAPTTAKPRTTTPPKPPSGGTDPRFGTCKAAKAAGYGPYVRGKDPEYDWYRDADHDGIDCE